ncbi:hypothetical protein HHI36_003396 [Cryptolaemus montrouzieri]|uniref:Uncharacterized protein n=1 Tax=Cryptolaemus montrouzieri TaxID=559131 RepID=A0ABD2PDB1_9CUCU
MWCMRWHICGPNREILETRIGEYKKDCRDEKEKSEAEILLTENNDSERMFLEAVKIGEFHNSINVQTDSRSISTFYSNILNQIKERKDERSRLDQHNNVT